MFCKPAKVPRRIFVYWASGFESAPRLVQLCAESWKIHNPSFSVVLLDDSNLRSYCDLSAFIEEKKFDRLDIQKKSDVIRMALLASHGGFWADATVYCTQPIEVFLSLRPLAGFHAIPGAPGSNRFFESYFLSSVPKGGFVTTWARHFTRYLSGNIRPMTRATQKRWWRRYPMLLSTRIGTVFWTIRAVARRTGYPYLIPHYIANRLFFSRPWWRFAWETARQPRAGQALRYERRENGLADFVADFVRGKQPLWKLSWREHLTPDFWNGVCATIERDIKERRDDP